VQNKQYGRDPMKTGMIWMNNNLAHPGIAGCCLLQGEGYRSIPGDSF
jgi:hypothetical protein